MDPETSIVLLDTAMLFPGAVISRYNSGGGVGATVGRKTGIGVGVGTTVISGLGVLVGSGVGARVGDGTMVGVTTITVGSGGTPPISTQGTSLTQLRHRNSITITKKYIGMSLVFNRNITLTTLL